MNMMTLCDFYKISHRLMYPQGMEYCYSTWTPRASRIAGVDHVVHFGLQMFIDDLNNLFVRHFFTKNKQQIVKEYKRIISSTLGISDPETKHIEDLHDLQYLPISIKSLPEGTVVPIRTPVMTIQNTDPRFFWLTNYIETFASCSLWQASTSATIAREYSKILTSAAEATFGDTLFVQFQGHDFSMRGMSSIASAVYSGVGHLTQFLGTDTIPAIEAAEQYYSANICKTGTSIPASEHSIQCAYGDDLVYFRRLINEVHPSGYVSIVSDGYDFWDVIGRVLPILKDEIMARNGKVVIRPDSGDPVKIVCGDPEAAVGSLEYKGAVEALWDIFGGTMTSKGYQLLDSHIGLIYGDAITRERATQIVNRLAEKGFASINVIFGIGSYTYQYNTRDTFGYALKSTLCVINGVEKQIFKDPKTDDGIKKSQKGRVAVFRDSWKDGYSLNDTIEGDLLREVYRDGEFLIKDTFEQIRLRAKV